MNPLVELESFYVATRRQAENGMMPVDEAVQLVNSRKITDASGVVWVVDVNASTQTKAAFLAGFPGQEPRPADPSSFAANPAQSSASSPSGSYQMAQPFTGVPSQPSSPLAPLQKQAPVASSKVKRSLPGKITGALSSVADRFAVTPKMVTALVGLFVVLAAAYAFLKMRSGSDEPAKPATVPTTAIATTTTALVPSTSPTTPPVETTPPSDIIAPIEPIEPIIP